jgi:hypothetical protein
MNPGSRRARERSLGSGSREEASSRRSSRLSKSSSAYRASADFRPARLTTFPPGLKFGEAHAREASRIVGWDRERAQREFERCRVWHLEHDTRRARWDGAWQSWCETGKDIDARNATRDAARRPRQKDFEAAQGASSWLERRRAAKASGANYVSNEEPEHVVEEVDDD